MAKHIFLIGAAKSGTTKLADMLNAHPEICLCDPKEPNFFTEKEFHQDKLNSYQSLFPKQDTEYLLDASTSYSAGWKKSSKSTAKRLFEYDSKAIIFYMVRNPVKRTWSSYWHSYRTGAEKRSVKEALSDDKNQHIQASMYQDRISDYLHYFEKNQISIINFEDFIKRPEIYADYLFTLLNLEKIAFSQNTQDKTVNQAYQWRGYFSFINMIPLKYVIKVNLIIKQWLPENAHKLIKSFLSKPVPLIDSSTTTFLHKKFETPQRKLHENYSDLFVKPE